MLYTVRSAIAAMAAMSAMSVTLEMGRMDVAVLCESASARNKRIEGNMEGKACTIGSGELPSHLYQELHNGIFQIEIAETKWGSV